MKSLLPFVLLVTYATGMGTSDVLSARIESCSGCSLNRLPELKKCIMEDVPKYDRVDVKFIAGAVPELVLLGVNDYEIDRLPLSQLDREQCNQLLLSKGFAKNKKSEF